MFSYLTAILRRVVQPVQTSSVSEKPPSIAPHCSIHGSQSQAFVCQYIADGLARRERVGFCWTIDDPGNPHPDAWCTKCEARRLKQAGGEWVGEAAEQLQAKIMCGACYGVAKTFHMGGDPWS